MTVQKKPARRVSTRDAAGSQTRKKDLPPLDAFADAKIDPELELRIDSLLTAVAEEDGRHYPPEWSAVADAAKRRGYLTERSLRLFLTNHGKQRLAVRASPSKGRMHEMTKIALNDRLVLKELAREVGEPMQDVIGYVIRAVYDHRDALTRYARKHGETHPWEAIRGLAKGL